MRSGAPRGAGELLYFLQPCWKKDDRRRSRVGSCPKGCRRVHARRDGIEPELRRVRGFSGQQAEAAVAAAALNLMLDAGCLDSVRHLDIPA